MFAAITNEELNLAKLSTYLIGQGLIDKNETIKSGKRFSGGTSNPTYLIESSVSSKRYVIRRKPFGKLLPGAHQIDREYFVTSKLSEVNFPVPKPYAYCKDVNVVGSEFYVSAYVEGRTFTNGLSDVTNPGDRAKMFSSMVEVLARLHEVDYQKLGLASLTTPEKANQSYVARQLKTWHLNYKQSLEAKTNYSKEASELMDHLYKYLQDNLPKQKEVCLIHGDYKIDQLIFHPTEPRVIAVVDWEMITIGDPIADLTYALCSFFSPPESSDADEKQKAIALTDSVYHYNAAGVQTLRAGIPPFDSLFWQYCSLRGTQSVYPLDDLTVYKAYQTFRVAAILQVVAARIARGTSSAKIPVDKLVAYSAAHVRCSARYCNLLPNYGQLIPQIPQLGERAVDLLHQLKAFMRDHVYPNEAKFEEQLAAFTAQGKRWSIPPVLEELKALAKAKGLWNLFLPSWSGITHREYATLAEEMGRNLWAAEVFNCQFPDTGNMETLHLFGTREQNAKYLEPLKNGVLRSAFVMTEPGVASSDAAQLQTKIERVGSNYVLNGKKWWISSGGDPRCQIFLVLGDTSMNEKDLEKRKQIPRHKKHSVVIVPRETPGIKIKTPMTMFGYDDAPYGHFEVDFDNVVVPCSNLLKAEGTGFEIAQARLGPGRLHHCMRTIGLGERTIELMIERMETRTVSNGTVALKEKDILRQELAEARIELNACRLLVLRAATGMDQVGSKNSKDLIAMAKVKVPNEVLKIIDRAMQIHGAVGLSHQFPLASWYARVRTVRFMDGPDVVHSLNIAKAQLNKNDKASRL